MDAKTSFFYIVIFLWGTYNFTYQLHCLPNNGFDQGV